MAHYACDCWDCEIKTSYGWIECVGHADRACYDLTVHAERTNTSMVASRNLPEPIQFDAYKPELNRKLVGMTFKGDQKKVVKHLEDMCEFGGNEVVEHFDALLGANGSAVIQDTDFEITREMVTFKMEKRTAMEEKFTPHVIEPSFGIGRILYALLEHSFHQRSEDEQRVVMTFRPSVAPTKVTFIPLLSKPAFENVANRLSSQMIALGINSRCDCTGAAIGRKYSRADELGTPFGVTIDGQTLLDQTVTVRERNFMSQIRVPMGDLITLIPSLCTLDGSDETDLEKWIRLTSRYPLISPPTFDSISYSFRNHDTSEERKENEEEEGEPCLIVEELPKARFSRPNPAR